MSQERKLDRRAVLRRSLGIAAGAAILAPTQWKKPVIDSVLLPVHAQTSGSPSTTPGFKTPTGGGPDAVMINAASETRTPSGGTSVDSLSQLTIAACVTLPGLTVTCSAVADLGGTTVNLGSSSSTSGSTGAFSTTINVPPASVAPTAAITSITVICSLAGGVTSPPMVFTPAQLSAALAGTATAPVCSL